MEQFRNRAYLYSFLINATIDVRPAKGNESGVVKLSGREQSKQTKAKYNLL